MNLYLVCDCDYIVAPDTATALTIWYDMTGMTPEAAAKDYPEGIETELLPADGTVKWDEEDGKGTQEVSVAQLIAERQGIPACIGSNNRG